MHYAMHYAMPCHAICATTNAGQRGRRGGTSGAAMTVQVRSGLATSRPRHATATHTRAHMHVVAAKTVHVRCSTEIGSNMGLLLSDQNNEVVKAPEAPGQHNNTAAAHRMRLFLCRCAQMEVCCCLSALERVWQGQGRKGMGKWMQMGHSIIRLAS